MNTRHACAFFFAVMLAVGCGGSKQPANTAGADGAQETDGSKTDGSGVAAGDGGKDGASSEGAAAKKTEESTPLSGQLTQAEIGEIVANNAKYFDECYGIGAGKNQELTGTVTVKATIGPSGSVNEAKVTKSTVKNPKVDTCVAEAFKKIKFPPPRDGGTSVITYAMKFEGVVEKK
jgi:TonB family protein